MPASRSRNTPDPHSGRFPPSQPRPQRPPAQTRAIGGTLFLCSFACSFSSCFARKAPVLGSVCAPRGPSVPLFFVRPDGPRFRLFVCAPSGPPVLCSLFAQRAPGSLFFCSLFFCSLFFCSLFFCSLFFCSFVLLFFVLLFFCSLFFCSFVLLFFVLCSFVPTPPAGPARLHTRAPAFPDRRRRPLAASGARSVVPGRSSPFRSRRYRRRGEASR
jgi:hypothetical protein